MRFRKSITALVGGLLAIGAAVAAPLPAAAVTYMPGDVFVGTENGIIQHRSPSGALIENLNTTLGNAFDTGMCFDLTGNLYATDIYSEAITKFGNMGNLVAAKWVDTSGDANNPESCIWDATNASSYVGGPSVNQIRQYDLTGAEINRRTVASPGGTGGTDWVDLSSDQCTVYYTNESETIFRFNTCTNTQLTPFATLTGASQCFALRIRPTTMEVMVACKDGAHLLSSTGANEMTYPLGQVFALNLDPNGTSFWTANLNGSTVYKVDIASGTTQLTFNAGATVWGLALFGEITAGGGGGGGCTSDQPISAQGTTISATEGQAFTGTVATFTDPDTTSTAADYSATIDWGDSTASSMGTITGSMGNFTVSGSHPYAEEGTYSVTVTINDTDCSTNSATANSTARVADAPLTSKCTAPPVSPQSFNGMTAEFDDTASTGMPSDFTATINWGDSHSSPGTITGGPGLVPYDVSGSHTYSSTGVFTITTTINDDGGSSTVATCTVTVFAFATSSGATFVIGDMEATPLNHVTWWSSMWAALNPMTGGPPPASMKGFAGFEDMPAIPNCGSSYTTDPGNSTPPPPTVPDYMGVIVSSKITQNGSVINGDIKEIVVVKNDPGYAPSPGHTGTGTIVAVVCM